MSAIIGIWRLAANSCAARASGVQLSPGDAADRGRPVASVQFAAEIEVGLELAEVGQHVLPGPAARANASHSS